MTVLITGATGLIGQEIVKLCLDQGITVHYLTTSKSKISLQDNYKGFYWNPKNNDIDTACFKGVDAIINLVGASISKRWTNSYKQEIIDSRVQSLRLLHHTIKTNNFPIKHLISASAIGYYPSSLTEVYNETFPTVSQSFLGQVVSQWEAEIDTFYNLNIATTKIRIGLVLSTKGGALPEMAKPIRLGVGAPMGSGKQWQSWVHVHDIAALFVYVLQQQFTGVYNGVAPEPVTNIELTKAIAKQLDRPLWLPNTPKFVMKTVLGQMHELLFESQKVSSQSIEESGFAFQYKTIVVALKSLFNSAK